MTGRVIENLILSILIVLISFSFLTCNDKDPTDGPVQINDTIDIVNQDTTDQTLSEDDYTSWAYNLTMYEVNVRQYTAEGTFAAFETHLQRLKDMGVGLLWFMPIYPIGEKNRLGSLGSYYSVKDYRDINPEFGTMVDFKDLVKEIHNNNMYVIIDWVANHTSWDNILTETHPEFYEKDSDGNFIPPPGTDWSDVIELDYSNQSLQDYMIETLIYWAEETGIDGFRFDAVDFVPSDFWKKATQALTEEKPDIFLLAEINDTKYFNYGFHMDYCWDLYGWGFGLSKRIYEGTATVNDLRSFLNNETAGSRENKYHMYFTSNHDENSWYGTTSEQLGESNLLFTVLAHTMNGMPMIYSGQEAGLNKRLSFFDKDEIVWTDLKYESFYTELADLKSQNSALWTGESGGKPINVFTTANNQIFAYLRKKDLDEVLVILNASADACQFHISDTLAYGTYTDIFSHDEVIVEEAGEFNLGPWEYYVLEH